MWRPSRANFGSGESKIEFGIAHGQLRGTCPIYKQVPSGEAGSVEVLKILREIKKWPEKFWPWIYRLNNLWMGISIGRNTSAMSSLEIILETIGAQITHSLSILGLVKPNVSNRPTRIEKLTELGRFTIFRERNSSDIEWIKCRRCTYKADTDGAFLDHVSLHKQAFPHDVESSETQRQPSQMALPYLYGRWIRSIRRIKPQESRNYHPALFTAQYESERQEQQSSIGSHQLAPIYSMRQKKSSWVCSLNLTH